MNERFVELARQATGYQTVGASDMGDWKVIEKFAELIVKECCDIMMELKTRPADLTVKDIKKHFGVE